MLRKKKKGISFFLALTMLLSSLNIALAEGTTEPDPPPTPSIVTVATASAIQDDEVEVTVSMTQNPGFSTYNLTVSYDKTVLVPVDIITTLDGTFTKNLDATGDNSAISAAFTSKNTETNLTGDTTLFTMKFRVLKEAVVGNTPLNITGSIKNLADTEVSYNATNGNVNVIAREYTVTVETDGLGAASSTKTKYTTGETVNLTAAANVNCSFKSWMSPDSVVFKDAKADKTSFVMPAKDVTIYASFVNNTVGDRIVNVICTPAEGGVARTDAEKYTVGDTVTVDATPKAGYYFKEWQTSDGVVFASKTAPTTSFTMPAKDAEITAVFANLSSSRFALTTHVEGKGNIAIDSNYFPSNTLVTLTATPAPNYAFKEWRTASNRVIFADKTNPVASIAMPSENVNITAVFEYNPGKRYTVTVLTQGGGTGETDKREYAVGERVILSATPKFAYLFYGWTSTDGITFLNPSAMNTSFIMPARKVTVTAMFTVNPNIGGGIGGGGTSGGGGTVGGGGNSSFESIHTINFDSQGGTPVSSVTVYNGGQIATPTAPTRQGFTFGGWYTTANCVDAYNFSAIVERSFTLYARWMPNEENERFKDVKRSDWFYDQVIYLAKNEIINGVTINTFKPCDCITRAQFAQILAKASGANTDTYEVQFKDVKPDSWYYKSVAWAKSMNIVNGTNVDKFSPDALITRQDMAVMLSRYIKNVSGTTPSSGTVIQFADSSSISSYAKDAVSEMQKYGIIGGKQNYRFAPLDQATRAEAAKMVYTLLKVTNKLQ